MGYRAYTTFSILRFMLSFQYPVWYILFCVLLGALYASVLYFRENSFREQSVWLQRGLAILRGTVVTLLAILLLSPVLKMMVTDIRKPIVVLAQDASESIGIANTPPQYQANFEALQKALGDNYDVKTYSFGEKVRENFDFSFKDKQTNISNLMQSVYDLHAGQNIGAVVVATDGIYNEGASPLYAAAKLNAPIYTIALGDTTPKRDIAIKRVFHNNIVYLGDKFNIQIDVAATNCVGANANLTVSRIDAAGNASGVGAATIAVVGNSFFATKEFTLDAPQAGVVHYRINVSGVSGEATTANNVKDIYIEVLDARTKVLILANSPHPDVAALQQTLSANKNYQVTIGYVNDLKTNVSEADFVILHQIPSLTNGADAIFSALNARRTPRLFIVGSQSDLVKMSAAQNIMSIKGDIKTTNDVQGILNPNFNLFTLDNSFKEIQNFNPMLAPFGDFKEISGGQVLFYQKIGKIDTKYPLIMLGEQQGIKTGIIAAEGIWKWRLFDFMQHQNHDIFDGLMSKMIQYLSVKEDKRKFRVAVEKNIFKENEPIRFTAELYNNSYELINEPDASLILTNSENKQFSYTFSKSGKSYTLDAGILPIGNYKFKGFTNFAGQKYEAEGAFSVQPIQLELYETTANHSLLKGMSQQTGGAFFEPQNMLAVADSIKAKNTIKPIMYSSYKTDTALNLKFIFFLLLALLSAEWFLRRYFGAY